VAVIAERTTKPRLYRLRPRAVAQFHDSDFDEELAGFEESDEAFEESDEEEESVFAAESFDVSSDLSD
jgi:hypothetical protein